MQKRYRGLPGSLTLDNRGGELSAVSIMPGAKERVSRC